jgi:hypothetical protein
MKKIRLNVANLEATDVLSREQLKSIFGGSGSGSGSSDGYTTCGEHGKPFCGNTAGKKCKKSSGGDGTCKSPQATTQCLCS